MAAVKHLVNIECLCFLPNVYTHRTTSIVPHQGCLSSVTINNTSYFTVSWLSTSSYWWLRVIFGELYFTSNYCFQLLCSYNLRGCIFAHAMWYHNYVVSQLCVLSWCWCWGTELFGLLCLIFQVVSLTGLQLRCSSPRFHFWSARTYVGFHLMGQAWLVLSPDAPYSGSPHNNEASPQYIVSSSRLCKQTTVEF